MPETYYHASIIMPFYGKWELCQARLYEMRLHLMSRYTLDIVLVDDCSPKPEEYAGNLAWWKTVITETTDSKFRCFKNDHNLGFGGAMNFGASKAISDVLVFLSNDVIIKGDFLGFIFNALEHRHDALVGAEMVDWDSGWNVVDKKVLKYLNGWLVACSKDTWNDIGGFDPRYGKFDAEDIDLSTTARSKGHELISFNQQLVHHLGSQTIHDVAPDRVEYTKRNIKALNEKWSGKLGNL